jgi:hypothetical protein
MNNLFIRLAARNLTMNRLLPLVLVEGLPFTGKSTLSEYIAQQLKLNGYPQQWVSEGVMLQQHFPHALTSFEDDNLYGRLPAAAG